MLIEARCGFEIIVLDDKSELFSKQNRAVCTKLDDVLFVKNKQNIGRMSSRNKLASLASNNWLLFLDSDVIPKSKSFIQCYLPFLDQNYDAIYGGYCYSKEKPSADYALRWAYGLKYEEVSASNRNSIPYKITLSGNCLIRKSVFKSIVEEIEKDGYGLDPIFSAIALKKNVSIFHIDNEVYHNGLDKNRDYLKKIKLAIKNELNYYNNKLLDLNSHTLFVIHKRLRAYGIDFLIAAGFKLCRSLLERNLLGSNPNMIVLQSYKLGYLCLISRQK